jgi:phenylalanine-4-hydroxylase
LIFTNETKKKQQNRVNLIHIESRPSKMEKGRYEFYVDCKAQTREILLNTIEQLKEKAVYLHILSRENTGDLSPEMGNLLQKKDFFKNYSICLNII